MVILDSLRERWSAEGVLLGAQYAFVGFASATVYDLIIMVNLRRLTDHECHTEFHPRDTPLNGADYCMSIVVDQGTIVLVVDDGHIECSNAASVVVALIRK